MKDKLWRGMKDRALNRADRRISRHTCGWQGFASASTFAKSRQTRFLMHLRDVADGVAA